MKMKKYIFFLVNLCCALLPAMADQPEHPELKASVWGIERSGFFNGREKWAKGFENQRV